MKIAFARMTMSVDIDWNNACMNCCEMRFAFFKRMVERGHSIKIYTPMSKHAEKSWYDIRSGKYEPPNGKRFVDNSYIKYLEYEPTGLVDKKTDVLMVETGATNFMFGCRYTKQPQLRRIAELLDNYEGMVILYQTDPDLPFPLWKFAKAKRDWYHKKNPYRNGNYKGFPNLESYGWGSYNEIFKNKKVLLVTFSLDVPYLKENYDGSRDRYAWFAKNGLIDVVGSVTPYCKDYVENIKFNYEPKFDVLYSGYPRGRFNRFEKLMMNKDTVRRVVTGPWDKKKELPLIEEDGIEYMGFIDYFYQIPYFTNKAKCLLHLAVPKSRKFSWSTSRIMEAINSKTVAFYDGDLTFYDDLVGREFALNGHEHAMKNFLKIHYMSQDDRFELWAKQWKRIKKYNWHWYADRFENYVWERIGKC